MNRLVYLITNAIKDYFERNKWREGVDERGRMMWTNDSGVEAKLMHVKYNGDDVNDLEVRISWKNNITFRVKVYIRGNYVTDILLDGEISAISESAPPVSVVSSMYVVAYELYELLNAIAKPYRP